MSETLLNKVERVSKNQIISVVLAPTVVALLIYRSIDNILINRELRKLSCNRTVEVSEIYNEDMKGIYVSDACYKGLYKVSSRNIPLYTCLPSTCGILIIDDPSNDEHYLGHWIPPSTIKEIQNSISENFPNLNNLKIYILQGDSPLESLSRMDYNPFTQKTIEKIYLALKNLGIHKQAYYIPPIPNENEYDEILIHQGRLMLSK